MNSHQIVLYTSYLHIIGGIETFVINFLDLMKDSYDIAVVCPKLPPEMSDRVRQRAKLYQRNESVTCDTLIMIRMMDKKPLNIYHEKSIRMCHATKSKPNWRILEDCNAIIHVSKASKSSFNSQGDVIYNPLIKTSKKAIILVSATRIPAADKGKNAERMLRLANMLNTAQIPFLWLNFSDAPLQNAPKGFMNVGTYQDLQPYIAKADYLVQLSDQEGFGLSVLEALMNQTAVICTPFETTKELGVIDGVNGYIVPFNMDFDVRKLLEVPEFTYSWDNESIKKKWDKLLKVKPKKQTGGMVCVEVIRPYKDVILGRSLRCGYQFAATKERAEELIEKGLVRRA